MDQQFWNTRYAAGHFVYGEEPNKYFEAQLKRFPPGSMLVAADGEGRNGVYAARQGWQVESFDLSENGRQKALQLAARHHVTIQYRVGDCLELTFPDQQVDALALIYAHFPASIKSACHQRLLRAVRPGGVVIFEAFSKNHLAQQAIYPHIGGPKDIDQLFSQAEILHDFAGCETLEISEELVELKEGPQHEGIGSVIRYVGRKL